MKIAVTGSSGLIGTAFAASNARAYNCMPRNPPGQGAGRLRHLNKIHEQPCCLCFPKKYIHQTWPPIALRRMHFERSPEARYCHLWQWSEIQLEDIDRNQ